MSENTSREDTLNQTDDSEEETSRFARPTRTELLAGHAAAIGSLVGDIVDDNIDNAIVAFDNAADTVENSVYVLRNDYLPRAGQIATGLAYLAQATIRAKAPAVRAALRTVATRAAERLRGE